MKLQHLVFTSLLALAMPAAATATEDYGLKGVTLGSHIGLIANNPKYDCRAARTPSADRVCGLRKDETETLAGLPALSVFYFYDQSALTGIVVHLEEKHFQAVVSALTAKYGASERRLERLNNLSGQPFENRIHSWRRDGQSIVAQRYSGRLDWSSVRISDEAAAARIKERRERAARQPERDL